MPSSINSIWVKGVCEEDGIGPPISFDEQVKEAFLLLPPPLSSFTPTPEMTLGFDDVDAGNACRGAFPLAFTFFELGLALASDEICWERLSTESVEGDAAGENRPKCRFELLGLATTGVRAERFESIEGLPSAQAMGFGRIWVLMRRLISSISPGSYFEGAVKGAGRKIDKILSFSLVQCMEHRRYSRATR